MLGPIGLPETLFILVLALLIFGPRRLPELGRTVGRALGEFRRATTELKRSINTEIALEDDEPRPQAPRRPALAEARPPAGSGADELPEPDDGGEAVWGAPAEPREEAVAAPLPPPPGDASAAAGPGPAREPTAEGRATEGPADEDRATDDAAEDRP